MIFFKTDSSEQTVKTHQFKTEQFGQGLINIIQENNLLKISVRAYGSIQI